MGKKSRQRESEAGYSKLRPEHQREAYAELIDSASIRIDSLNLATMELIHLESFANFLKYELSTNGLPQGTDSIITKNDGKTWQILKDFYTSPTHGDLLFCSRTNGGKNEFAVISKLKSGSVGAEHFGETKLHVIGDDAALTLDRFLEYERQLVFDIKKGCEHAITQKLFDQFLDEDCKEVFTTVSRVSKDTQVEPSAAMLKRDGEYCKHKVPGFPGLLTASEYEAYIDVRAAVLSLRKKEAIHPSIENIVSHWEKLATRLVGENAPRSIRPIIRSMDEKTWEIYEIFSKPDLESETLFCSREEHGQREFAIIETMTLNRDMASFGEMQIHALGNNISQVLRDFFKVEQNFLQSSREEFEITVSDRLRRRLSPGGCARVSKAIAALYDNENLVAENTSNGISANTLTQKNGETFKGRRIC